MQGQSHPKGKKVVVLQEVSILRYQTGETKLMAELSHWLKSKTQKKKTLMNWWGHLRSLRLLCLRILGMLVSHSVGLFLHLNAICIVSPCIGHKCKQYHLKILLNYIFHLDNVVPKGHFSFGQHQKHRLWPVPSFWACLKVLFLDFQLISIKLKLI